MKENQPVCTVAKRCGGCQFSGTPYEEQLKEKQKAMERLFGGLCRVEPIIGMQDPLWYRNKVHHVFGRDKKGNVLAGCYEANSHRIVDIENCLIEDRKCQEIIATVKGLLRSFKIRIYDEDSGFGLLRHVLVRRGFASGEIMVVLVLTSQILPGKNNFVKALLKVHPDITTIILNVNDRDTSMVLGSVSKVLYGPGFIRDRLCGCTFRISPDSFYQVNSVQTERLYQTAIEFAGFEEENAGTTAKKKTSVQDPATDGSTGRTEIIDAYCGIGTIGLAAARAVPSCHVTGIELNPDAVRDARANAKENQIRNADFLAGDAGQYMTKLSEQGRKADVVFMDPPRSGSTEAFMKAAAGMEPDRIVYVSCGPDTLKRDLLVFQKLGYRPERIQPVDMFPFTKDVENVVLLKRNMQ